MAIRNLDAIQRQGKMLEEQRSNAKRIRNEFFWKRVNIIRESRLNAIDAIDTIDALCKNGLRTKFEEWMKHQNVYFVNYRKEFSIGCKVEDSRRETARVSYNPYTDMVHFGWNGWGMCEGYDIGYTDNDYFLNQRLDEKGYNDGLTSLSERLKPFLDAFFKWIETL